MSDASNFLSDVPRNDLDVGGRRISVYDTGGDGTPLFFVHGNSSSARAWAKQFEGTLTKRHRLVAIDLPGHGSSGAVPESLRGATYNLPGYADVVAGVARQCGCERAIFVGWSLGGHILLEAADLLAEAPGFLIFGTPPIGFPPDMSAFLKLGLGFVADLTDEQAHEFASEFFMTGAKDIPEFVFADVRRTDGAAREGLGASIAPDGYSDELDIVANLTRPLAVLQGAGEQIVNPAYLSSVKMPTLWRGAVQTVVDAGHAIQWEQATEFDRLVSEFAADCGAA
jgi:pimeloyl-ACP methyl ester carboxylesterase